ncbi:Peptidyl-prolyl cis-trans isomerase CYP59, partial [Smittium mucronatum]
CEIVADAKTGESLGYAFIEFVDKSACEEAFFKMDNVLIDDRRIKVDFSQSVSRLHYPYPQPNGVRVGSAPSVGGDSSLQEFSRYRYSSQKRGTGYEMVFGHDRPGPSSPSQSLSPNESSPASYKNSAQKRDDSCRNHKQNDDSYRNHKYNDRYKDQSSRRDRDSYRDYRYNSSSRYKDRNGSKDRTNSHDRNESTKYNRKSRSKDTHRVRDRDRDEDDYRTKRHDRDTDRRRRRD